MLKNDSPNTGQNISDLKPINNVFLDNAIDKLAFETSTFLKKYNAKVLLFSGCSAKCGTTTIAKFLAIKLAKLGYKTVLLDINMRKDYDFKKKFTLSHYLTINDFTMGRIIYNDHSIDNLKYINGGFLQKDFMESLSSQKMKNLMKHLDEAYDVIIIDSPAITVVSDAEIMFEYADGISLVMSLNATKKSQLAAGKNIMKAYKDKYLGLVINNIDIIEYKKISPQYNYFSNEEIKANKSFENNNGEEENISKKEKDYDKGGIKK